MSTWLDEVSVANSRTNLGVTTVVTTNGAWVPSISPLTGGTLSSVTGKYTQYLIGANRMVFMNGVFVIATLPTPTAWTVGTGTIIALPYTSIATNQYISVTVGNAAGAVETINCRISGSSTTITSLLPSGWTPLAGDTFTLSFSYQAV